MQSWRRKMSSNCADIFRNMKCILKTYHSWSFKLVGIVTDAEFTILSVVCVHINLVIFWPWQGLLVLQGRFYLVEWMNCECIITPDSRLDPIDLNYT